MTVFYNDGSGVRNVRELENKAWPDMNLCQRASINKSRVSSTFSKKK